MITNHVGNPITTWSPPGSNYALFFYFSSFFLFLFKKKHWEESFQSWCDVGGPVIGIIVSYIVKYHTRVEWWFVSVEFLLKTHQYLSVKLHIIVFLFRKPDPMYVHLRYILYVWNICSLITQSTFPTYNSVFRENWAFHKPFFFLFFFPPTTLSTPNSTPLQPGKSPSQNPIPKQNRQHDSYPFSFVSDAVAVQRQDSFAVDLALGCETGLIHTLASGATIISAVAKFVYHHATEDVCLLSGYWQASVFCGLWKVKEGGGGRGC